MIAYSLFAKINKRWRKILGRKFNVDVCKNLFQFFFCIQGILECNKQTICFHLFFNEFKNTISFFLFHADKRDSGNNDVVLNISLKCRFDIFNVDFDV